MSNLKRVKFDRVGSSTLAQAFHIEKNHYYFKSADDTDISIVNGSFVLVVEKCPVLFKEKIRLTPADIGTVQYNIVLYGTVLCFINVHYLRNLDDAEENNRKEESV